MKERKEGNYKNKPFSLKNQYELNIDYIVFASPILRRTRAIVRVSTTSRIIWAAAKQGTIEASVK